MIHTLKKALETNRILKTSKLYTVSWYKLRDKVTNHTGKLDF